MRDEQTRDSWGRWTLRGPAPTGTALVRPPRGLAPAAAARWATTTTGGDKSYEGVELPHTGGEATFGPDGLERKVAVSGSLDSEAEGIVTCLASVTGLVDRVADLIVPGAYTDTLKIRIPKVVLYHDWTLAVGKCDPIVELMPGDPRLPAVLPTGDPWPGEAGALVARVIFNMGKRLGQDAWADASFFGDDQEWCADAETEILTARGWLRYDQLAVGDFAYGFDPASLRARFDPVEAVNVFPSARRTLRHIETGGFSSLTTGAHRWPVRFPDGHTGWRTTSELTTSDAFIRSLPNSEAPTDPKWADPFVELVAWFWTEGWTEYHAACIGQSSVRHPQHVSAIRSALAAVFPDGWTEHTRSDGMVHFRLGIQASAALQAVVGAGKAPRPDLLLSLTRSQLELLIRRCLDGDGHITPTGQATWYQVNPAGVAAFQMACALAGVSTAAHQPKDYGDRYGSVPQNVSLLRSAVTAPLASIHTKRGVDRPSRTPSTDEWVQHDGIVWCPTTPTGTWLARRNGSVYFTGNSIGYNVPGGSALKRSDGVRVLPRLDVYEISMVLWGAMPLARTVQAIGGVTA